MEGARRHSLPARGIEWTKGQELAADWRGASSEAPVEQVPELIFLTHGFLGFLGISDFVHDANVLRGLVRRILHRETGSCMDSESLLRPMS